VGGLQQHPVLDQGGHRIHLASMPVRRCSSPQSPSPMRWGRSVAVGKGPFVDDLDRWKNHAWLKRRTAALNLRNLIGRGLTRIDRTWALAI
jgi:hypothetical protein